MNEKFKCIPTDGVWTHPFKGYKIELFGWTFIIHYHRTMPKRLNILNPEYLFAKYEEFPDGFGGFVVARVSGVGNPISMTSGTSDSYPKRGNVLVDGKIVEEIPPRKLIYK